MLSSRFSAGQLVTNCAIVALTSFAIPSAIGLHAQGSGDRFDLSVANIMRGPELYGREPQDVRWSADGRWIYFRWNEPGAAWSEPSHSFRVRAVAGSKPEQVSSAHMDSVGAIIADGARSRDGRTMAVSYRGDIYLVDTRAGTSRRLTETLAAENAPSFTLDESGIVYTKDNNAYEVTLATGAVRQLTDMRTGPAPRDSARPSGMRASLERQQLELFEVARERVRADSIAKAERADAIARGLHTVYLNAGERLANISLSPSLRTAIVLTASNTSSGARQTQIPNYITNSGFTEEISGRTKVGDSGARFRAYRLDVASGRMQPLAVVGGDSSKPASQIRTIDWNADGTTALLSASTPDFKWRYIVAVGESGAPRTVDGLRDSAWVGGPCSGCMGWLPDGRVWFVSEASGYAQLYAANADGTSRTSLTEGNWEVLSAELSPDRKWFWMHTSEVSPFVRHFYRMSVNGGKREQLTKAAGGHEVTMSPDGTRMADVFSEANVPPELFVADVGDASRAKLTTSTTAEFRAGPWIKPAIVNIRASDGVEVPTRIYRPADLGAQPNGAAVIFVHGAGYLHNVHDYWSSYSREYMFNHLLASKGYVVIDMDYRASAGYGRDWRTAIYRFMGGRDLQDNVDGSRWLQKEYGIDPERIGLYGGSYGGFMTLMALFNAPKEFGAGAALRSVTDWAHYNNGYTGSILNLPQDDSLAYRRSSPIYFAQNLEDPLLMAHGMVDQNVHYEDIVRLTQRFIELGKTDWELASYPVEDHGFVRPSSWTDEYRRILELFEKTIGPQGSKAAKR